MSDIKKSIGDEINLFVNHLDSLRETLFPALLIVGGIGKNSYEDYTKFVKEKCTKEGDQIIVEPEHHKDYKDKSRKVRTYNTASVLVPRSFLVSMVSQYDAYLGRLLRTIFLLKPELLINSEKKYSFEDLSRYSSMDEFKEHAIEKEIESILRDSHEEQFKYMERKFSISLTKDLKVWPRFIELTERRNLFVHTDGTVSRYYLDTCKKIGISTDDLKEGDKLKVSQDYFEIAYECLYEIGVKLGHVLWRKLFFEEVEDADNSFNNAILDLIQYKKFNLACALADSALEMWDKKFFDEASKLCLLINSAQSHKWAGRSDISKKIMSGQDWSAKEDKFKLADAVLKEDWVKSTELMKKLGSAENMHLAYQDWPLFKDLKKQDLFLKTYKDVFGKNFEVEISASDLETSNTEEKLTINI